MAFISEEERNAENLTAVIKAKLLILWAREHGIILQRLKLGDLELELHDPTAVLQAQVENVNRVDGALGRAVEQELDHANAKPPPTSFYDEYANQHSDYVKEPI